MTGPAGPSTTCAAGGVEVPIEGDSDLFGAGHEHGEAIAP